MMSAAREDDALPETTVVGGNCAQSPRSGFLLGALHMMSAAYASRGTRNPMPEGFRSTWTVRGDEFTRGWNCKVTAPGGAPVHPARSAPNRMRLGRGDDFMPLEARYGTGKSVFYKMERSTGSNLVGWIASTDVRCQVAMLE